MAVAGGSAGGALAIIYAYRDGTSSPVPIKFVYQAVGPASFEPEAWYNMVEDVEASAEWVSTMTGTKVTAEMIESGEYKEILKPISAYEWVDENTVPTLIAYGVQDKVVPYATAKYLLNAFEENNMLTMIILHLNILVTACIETERKQSYSLNN